MTCPPGSASLLAKSYRQRVQSKGFTPPDVPQLTTCQIRQPQQVLHPKRRSSRRHDDKRIRRRDAGPAPRHASHSVAIIEVNDPVLTPTTALIEQLEPLPVQRVIRVRYLKGSFNRDRTGCS